MNANYLLLILVFVFSSCRKKEVIIEDKLTELTVGEINSSVSSMIYPIPISIPVEYDTLNLYGVGSYSFDFDLDGEHEITIVLNLINNDSIHLLNGATISPYPSLSLISDKEIATLTENEEVYVGQGSTVTFSWVKALTVGETIKNISNWNELNEEGTKMWHEMPLALSHKGTWYDLDENRFVAFRYENKLGWIEINATDFSNPLIIGYGIQR